jgi:ribosomal protein L11 methyltransferase
VTVTRRVLFRLPAAREDDLAAELWELGTLGLQVLPPPGAPLPWAGPEHPDEEIHLEAWFGDGDEPDWAATSVASWVESSEPQEDRDWLDVWRREARPVAVGESFLIDPREPGQDGVPAAETGRRTLHLPARNAFGTGSHESTRLALLLLERLDLDGRSVLDAGTGTGVLAFAALHLGATRAVGYDIDPAAAVHARDNGRRNGLALALFAGTGVALAPHYRRTRTFDVLVVNMIPENALPELPHLLPLLAAGGEVVLSGCLVEHVERVTGELAALGLRVRETIHEGEWAGMVAVVEERGTDDA